MIRTSFHTILGVEGGASQNLGNHRINTPCIEVKMKSSNQKKLIGEFLRTRRERLNPDDFGFENTRRRRTSGLRREEVAELADISTAWYTYLEQGRDVQASEQALVRIACALKLDSAEREHLFALSRPSFEHLLKEAAIPKSLTKTVEGFSPYPAMILNHAWDIVEWNESAISLFKDFITIRKERRNLVIYVFTDEAIQKMYQDWEANARLLLAQFRASQALFPNELRFQQIKNLLLRESEPFSSWWSEHELNSQSSGSKVFIHPVVGRLLLSYTAFQSLDHPQLRLVTYMPQDDVSDKRIRYL